MKPTPRTGLLRQALISFFLLTGLVYSHAQDKEPFDISIADKTEEPALLKKNETQLEAAFLRNYYTYDPSSSIFQGMVRYGLSNSLEVRLITEQGPGRDRYITKTTQSTYPLAAGMKVKLLENHQWLPDMTLVTYIHIPFAARKKAERLYWSPLIFMAFQHKLSEKWSLDYNAGAQQTAYGNSWAAVLNASVHYKMTDPLEIFGEYFAQYEPLEDPQHNLGGGISYVVNSWLALFVSGGSTIFSADGNYYFSGGAAVKLHGHVARK
jgi:Putative MetA-pathway of phenol degradation